MVQALSHDSLYLLGLDSFRMLVYTNIMTQRQAAPQRKNLLLEAARRVIQIKGFDGLTTAAIAKAAKVSEPILYRHFSSKAALVSQLLDRVLGGVLSRLDEIGRDASEPMDALHRLCAAYPRIAAEHESEFALINQLLVSTNDPRLDELLRRHYDAYVVRLSALIESAQADGKIRRDFPPRDAAWHLVHAALGYLVTRRLRARETKESQMLWSQAAMDALLPRYAY